MYLQLNNALVITSSLGLVEGYETLFTQVRATAHESNTDARVILLIKIAHTELAAHE